VNEDVACGPADVGLLGANGMVFEVNGVSSGLDRLRLFRYNVWEVNHEHTPKECAWIHHTRGVPQIQPCGLFRRIPCKIPKWWGKTDSV